MWLMSNSPAAVRTACVLLDDAGVLDRHVPAGEIDHAGAVGDVPVMQHRSLTRHGRTSGLGMLVCWELADILMV